MDTISSLMRRESREKRRERVYERNRERKGREERGGGAKTQGEAHFEREIIDSILMIQ